MDFRPLTHSASLLLLNLALVATPAAAQPVISALQFPTANHSLLQPGREEDFFVGTVGKPARSGAFGCVRTEGWQLHEGIDIRCLERDRTGEPTDPIRATADGTVAYVSHKAALSSYGIYLILRHHIDSIEIYSLYSHLSAIAPGIQPGQTVRAGDVVATMGRTANTRQTISRDRAHLHFELNLLVNDRFEDWHRRFVGSRNDHGLYNGQNFLGLDPALLLQSAHRFTTNFHLARYLRAQPPLCRVAVRDTQFPWLRRYAALIDPRTLPPGESIAGYELHLDFVGVPCRIIPRTPSELPGRSRFTLLAVDQQEYTRNPCRRLVVKRGTEWELGRNGTRLLELLTF